MPKIKYLRQGTAFVFPTRLHVCTAKTQVSLRRPEQANQSLCCPPEDTLATPVSCEEWDQTARMYRLI